MAKDVDCAIRHASLEIAVPEREPAVHYLRHLERTVVEQKPAGRFFPGLVGVAFDPDFHLRRAPRSDRGGRGPSKEPATRAGQQMRMPWISSP